MCVCVCVCIYIYIYIYIFVCVAILADTLNQAETLQHSLEQAAAGIGVHVNAHKTK